MEASVDAPVLLVRGELPASLPDAERRLAERFLCRRRPRARMLTRPDLDQLTAVIDNISAYGVRLISDRSLSRGTVLALGLLDTRPSFIQSARVVYSIRLADGKWAVGCRFFPPVQESDIESLWD
jgi:hypothetical protein